MARISIVTPIFNGKKYISACVENVAAQQVDGLEHIIIDGGSTDGTVNCLKELAARWRHVKFLSEPDQGQSDAMNKGIKLAEADIIGVLNADDFYADGAVRDAVSYLEFNTSIEFVVGDCHVLVADDELYWINRPSDLRIESLVLGWDYNKFPVNPSAYFYRKAIHEKVGPYALSEHYAMDVAFLFASAEKVRMAYVPRHWGNFRFVAGTKTFDDDKGSGSARVRAICAEHISRFTTQQRIKMTLIKSALDLRRLPGRAFGRIGRVFHRSTSIQ